MNYDNWKQMTPEDEMNLQQFAINVSFEIHKTDVAAVTILFKEQFTNPYISFRDLGGDIVRVYAEFTGEYQENDVEDMVRDALYPTVRDMGLMYSEINVCFD